MACAISILIVLVGFISLKSLSIEQYPDIAPPTIYVTTSYTGADANTVMNSVIMPLEEAINGVENMMYITSTASSDGAAEIVVYFRQGTSADMASVNVQNRVSSAMGLLPAEVTKVGVQVEKKQTSMLRVAGIESTDGKFDTDFLANYIDINIKPRLLRIQGVGNVNCLGNTYSLRIWLKPDVMAKYNLTPDEVFSAVTSQNMVAPAGSFGEMSDKTLQFTMEYKGRLTTIEEFEDIVIKARDEGQVLCLKDIADVELGSMNYTYVSNVNDNPGVLMMVFQTSGANATKINAEIDELFHNMEDQLPPGVRLLSLKSSNDFLFAAIHSVVETLIIAILLVIIVVYFFLQNFKATIIPSISICVSVLGTFAVVKAAGFSMNILTLFALVLSIGTVVDDSIVVVEAVMAKIESGYKSSHKATRDAMSEVSMAVISCTLVFMAVFIPVTFMPGTSGTFFTQFGVTIASAVGLSCLNAMTLCPALCAMLMRPSGDDGDKKTVNYYVKQAYQASYSAIYNKYMKAVAPFIRHPKVSWALLAVAVAALFYLMKVMPAGLVPQEDQGAMMVDITTAPGTTLHDTNLIALEVEKRLKSIPDVENYSCLCGFGLLSGVGTNHGTMVARLKPWDERKGPSHSIGAIMRKFNSLCEDIKEVSLVTFQTPQIPGYGNSNCIELMLEDLYGGDKVKFKELSDRFLQELRNHPDIGMAMSTTSDGYPKYKVDVDAVQCGRAGILPSEVLSVLGSFCGGAYISNYNQYGKVYRVMAASSPEYRYSPIDLENMFVKVKGGKMAPLSQFVNLKKTSGESVQKRFNLFQSINCQVMPMPGVSDGEALTAIREVAAKVLPAGYSYEYSGMSREMAENAESNMTVLIYVISIFLIYLILGCLYESWFIPFSVLLSVPFGLMGSFLVSHLCGMDNNVFLQTGVIMLIGLLSKAAILITEFAVANHGRGMSVMDSAIAACRERLRPILMTVFTMVVGMIPLIIEGGAGANGNRSLAVGVVGGMCLGTVAMLFVVPAFYIVFQNIHDKFKKSEDVEDE